MTIRPILNQKKPCDAQWDGMFGAPSRSRGLGRLSVTSCRQMMIVTRQIAHLIDFVDHGSRRHPNPDPKLGVGLGHHMHHIPSISSTKPPATSSNNIL